MKASEFDIKEPIYSKIEHITKEKCEKEGVYYYNYLGVFVRYLLPNYHNSRKLISVIEDLDFGDFISTRAILNKRNFSSKQYELHEAEKVFLQHRKKIFDWLNSTEDPLFFIFNPVYEYGAGTGYGSWVHPMYGYKKNRATGCIDDNIKLAIDYIKSNENI